MHLCVCTRGTVMHVSHADALRLRCAALHSAVHVWCLQRSAGERVMRAMVPFNNLFPLQPLPLIIMNLVLCYVPMPGHAMSVCMQAFRVALRMPNASVPCMAALVLSCGPKMQRLPSHSAHMACMHAVVVRE